MKILVTGANGYLGQGIVKQLIEDNNEVITEPDAISIIEKITNKITRFPFAQIT